MKFDKAIALFLVGLMLLAIPVTAQQAGDEDPGEITTTTTYLKVTQVKINGDTAEDGDDLYVERGDVLDLRVTVEAGSADVENAQIEAFIAGYKYAKYERELVTDYTKTFDLPAGDKRSFDLQLEIPYDMEMKDAKLRIVVSDENSPNLIVYNYQLSIYGTDESKAVQIRDFLVSPSNDIEAGRALSFKVKVKNIGNDDLDDVKVTVEIPELNVRAHETIDTLDSEEVQSFESLIIRIPTDAQSGTYEAIATVEFDRYEEVSESMEITVTKGTSMTGGSEEEGKTVVTVPESVELTKGTSGAVYPVLIKNDGDSSKTYIVSVSGVDEWGTASVEPSSVMIIKAGESKTVYVRLTAKDDAEAGDKVFKVSITAGEETREVSAYAKVKDGETQGPSAAVVVQWVLVVLIALLIILGLIFIITRMRKDGGDSDEETQTYY